MLNQNDLFIRALIKKFNGKFVEDYPCKGMSTKNADLKNLHSVGDQTLKSFSGKRTVKTRNIKNEYNNLF